MGAQDADRALLDEERAAQQRSPEPSVLRKQLYSDISESSVKDNIDQRIENHAAATQRSQTPVAIDQFISAKQDPPLSDNAWSLDEMVPAPGVPICEQTTSSLPNHPPVSLDTTPAKSSQLREKRFEALRSYLNRQLADLRPSEFLFRAGALTYLLFVLKISQKIWQMIRSEPHSFAVGHLALSMGVVAFTWYYVPGQVQRTSFPCAVITITIFIGAFVCVSVSWSMIRIVNELVALALRSGRLS
ncbi:hypothetical protein EV361DRAFT_955845 [Lentinula raphanica]|nr:hypothetical protein EV361DRAFT_955845 [Lentinula raphanica]